MAKTNFVKDNFQTILLVMLAVGLIVSMGNQPTINVSSEGEPLFNTLAVSGRAEVKTEADEAEISVGILTEDVEAGAAEQANSQVSNGIIDALKAAGVRDSEIETTSYSVYPKTSYNKETGESEIYGYRVSHTLTVTTTKTKDVGKIVDAAVGAGANNVNRINFKLSDEKQKLIYSQALEQASKEGAAKAGSMAQALSVSLVRLKSVSESGVSYSPYPVYREALGGADFEETQIMPQELTVSASVSMVYEIK